MYVNVIYCIAYVKGITHKNAHITWWYIHIYVNPCAYFTLKYCVLGLTQLVAPMAIQSAESCNVICFLMFLYNHNQTQTNMYLQQTYLV